MLKKLSYSLLLFIVFTGVVLQGCAAKTPAVEGSWEFDIEGKTEMFKEESKVIARYRGQSGGNQKFMYNDPASWDKVYEFKASADAHVSISFVATDNAALVGRKLILNYYSKDGKKLHQSIENTFKKDYDPGAFAYVSWKEVRDAGDIRVVLFFSLEGVEYFTQLPQVNVYTKTPQVNVTTS